MLFISSKKLFSFLRYSIFWISIFPLLFLVDNCFRGWSQINIKVYDVINCLNRNLITHFVWYLEKEKGMTLKLRQLIEYYIRNIFMVNSSSRKSALKASPRPLFNFGKWLHTTFACRKFCLKIDNLKDDYQKALKILTLFFLSNPVSFNGQDKEKRRLELVTCCSLGWKTSSAKFLY